MGGVGWMARRLAVAAAILVSVSGSAEARAITTAPEGVSNYEWSPDGRPIFRLVARLARRVEG
jgi:dipeptidyl aminopeptidase/acylaminoacyl peptidase